VDAVDGGILSRMRRAGCIQISYGVESGSPAIRRRLGKTFSDEEVRLAFEETLRHGILPRAYFIYGCPGESPETVAETLALIGRIRPLAAVFYLLDLFPGTELYRDFCRRTGADDDIWLRRIEDIPYFETDPDLTREAVLSYGRQLRSGFYRMLPGFVRSITLVEADGFAPLHADFLSRLAMTFHRGEYRDRPEIPDASAIAAGLYRDALERHPVPRAYLGLGMLHQESGRFAEAETLLASALERFPGHEELTVCLGLVLMNTGRFPEALRRLAPFEDRPAAARLVAECRRRAAP
jgi:tetratricopeptide (TPR) repeat protein